MVKSSLSPPSQHRHSALLHFFLKSNCFPITSLGRAASCGVLERFVTCSCEVLKHPSSKEKGGDKDGNYGVGIPEYKEAILTGVYLLIWRGGLDE